MTGQKAGFFTSVVVGSVSAKLKPARFKMTKRPFTETGNRPLFINTLPTSCLATCQQKRNQAEVNASRQNAGIVGPAVTPDDPHAWCDANWPTHQVQIFA